MFLPRLRLPTLAKSSSRFSGTVRSYTALPSPRRIVAGHSATGAAVVYDEHVSMAEGGKSKGRRSASIFVTPVPCPDPLRAIEGKDVTPLGPYSDKAQVRWVGESRVFGRQGDVGMGLIVDVPPGMTTSLHFTPTVDIGIITHGQIELIFHEGEPKVVNTGDVVVQLANVHGWRNTTDTPTRGSSLNGLS